VRRALGPLHQIAAKHGCAVLMIRHLNKVGHGRAHYRGGGSIGFQGACRSTWLVERDPADPGGLVLAQVKNNLAGLQTSLSFAVSKSASAELDAKARTLTWRGSSPFSADQLLTATGSSGRDQTEVGRACEFLKKLLEEGPLSTPAIWEAGKAQGFSERTMRQAKSDLGVRSKRVGTGHEHRAYWSLKDQEPQPGAANEEAEVDLSRWLDPLIAAYPPTNPLDDV
jgi:hypothetical protein